MYIMLINKYRVKMLIQVLRINVLSQNVDHCDCHAERKQHLMCGLI